MSVNPKKKEWKYVQCFRAPYAGKCTYCKTRSWKATFKIYYMKTHDGKVFKCSDKKCFLDQGGRLTVHHDDDIGRLHKITENTHKFAVDSTADLTDTKKKPDYAISKKAFGMIIQILSQHHLGYTDIGSIVSSLEDLVFDEESEK